jgi:hypothetical protein
MDVLAGKNELRVAESVELDHLDDDAGYGLALIERGRRGGCDRPGATGGR